MTNSSQISTPAAADSAVAFIARWQSSGAAERANYQLFLTEMCEILGVPKPEPRRPKIEENSHVFERDVTFQNLDGTTSIGRIDIYKRGCFVLEAKQGSEQVVADEFRLTPADNKTSRAKKGTAVRGTKGWDDAMFKARGQAEQYARALPIDEGWPRILIVADVDHTIELFADFTRSGKVYLPFPDLGTHRIKLDKLNDPAILEFLRAAYQSCPPDSESLRHFELAVNRARARPRMPTWSKRAGAQATELEQGAKRCRTGSGYAVSAIGSTCVLPGKCIGRLHLHSYLPTFVTFVIA